MTALPVDDRPSRARARTEIQVAADTVLRLDEAGFLDVSMRDACRAAGISLRALQDARDRRTSAAALGHAEPIPRPSADPTVRKDGRRITSADPGWAPRETRSDGRPNTTRPTTVVDGEKTCPGCGETLPLTAYDRRAPENPRPKARCRECIRRDQAARYVTVSRRAALAVGEFVLRSADVDVVGSACPACGDPLCVGDTVRLVGALVHDGCDTSGVIL